MDVNNLDLEKFELEEIKDKAFGSIEQEQDKKIEFKKSDNGFVF